MSIKGNIYSKLDTSNDKRKQSTILDLQNTQEVEECELLVRCMNITEKIPLLFFCNKAKITNLNEINLLLEIVESWIFENKKTSHKEYQAEYETFFAQKKNAITELLIDVEDEQVKIINLIKMGNLLIVESVQDFRILRVILNRSKTYLNEILRLNEITYYNNLKNLINWTLSNIPTFFAETSESKFIDKLQLNKDFNSFQHVAKNFDELAVQAKNDDSHAKNHKLYLSPLRSDDDNQENIERIGDDDYQTRELKFYPKIEKIDSNSRDFGNINLSSSNSVAEQLSEKRARLDSKNKSKSDNHRKSSEEHPSSGSATAKFQSGKTGNNSSNKTGKSQTNANITDKSSQYFLSSEFNKNIAFSSMVNDAPPENQNLLEISDIPIQTVEKNITPTEIPTDVEESYKDKKNNYQTTVEENTNELSYISGFNTDKKDIEKQVNIVNNELSPNTGDNTDKLNLSGDYSAVQDYKHNRSLETFYFEPNTIELTVDDVFEIDVSEEFERQPIIKKVSQPEEIVQFPEINYKNLEQIKQKSIKKCCQKLNEAGAIEYNFSNGKYKGQLDKKTQLKVGFGLFLYNNGDIYEGCFDKDLKHGDGKYWFFNKDLYMGQFLKDLKEGEGIYYYSSGSRYFGQWKYDKRHGQGTFQFRSGARYEGTFNDGKRDGYGTYTFSNKKEVYVGNFQENKYHGHGVLWSGVGQYRYEGDFRDGFFNGLGKEFDELGKVIFVGKWKDGKKVGKNMLEKNTKKNNHENAIKIFDDNACDQKEVLIMGKNLNLQLKKSDKNKYETVNPIIQNQKILTKNRQTMSEAQQIVPKGLSKVKSTANLKENFKSYQLEYRNNIQPEYYVPWVEQSSLISCETNKVNNDSNTNNSNQNILDTYDLVNNKFNKQRDSFKVKLQNFDNAPPRINEVYKRPDKSNTNMNNLNKNSINTMSSKNIKASNHNAKVTSISPSKQKYQNHSMKHIKPERNFNTGSSKNVTSKINIQKKSMTPVRNNNFIAKNKTDLLEHPIKNKIVSDKLQIMRRNKKELMMEIVEKERVSERRSGRDYGRSLRTPTKE